MSTIIELRFPAGRYHATPWGRHVNEGAIEWPPSPWRLCRTLMAVGYNRLWFTEPPAEGISLLQKIASVLPTYYLPRSGAAHTRHYMPLFKGNTTKVLDTFAIVDPNDSLAVELPVDLDEIESRTLDALLARLTYVGRAESWVEARRAQGVPREFHSRCVPEQADKEQEQVDQTELLAPETASSFATWRALAVESACRARLEDLLRLNQKKESRRNSPSELPSKERLSIEAQFPANVLEALKADTGDLRKEGWSQPPGSRWVSWWLRADALSSIRRIRRARQGPIADTALFAMRAATKHSRVLPRITETYSRAEIVHQTLVGLSDRKDGRGPSSVFTGAASGHQHAAIIPLSLSARDRIDHILVFAKGGFDDRALFALDRLQATWSKEGAFRLSRLFLGPREDLDLAAIKSPSRVWESRTPFVPPLHLKERGKGSLSGQIAGGLAICELAAPERVEVLIGGRWESPDEFWGAWKKKLPELTARWRGFTRVGRKNRGLIAWQPSVGLRLTFAASIEGPLMLGYGSHFGLGHFVPA